MICVSRNGNGLPQLTTEQDELIVWLNVVVHDVASICFIVLPQLVY